MHSNRTTQRWLRYAGVLAAVMLLGVHAANAAEQGDGSNATGKPADAAQVVIEARFVEGSSPFLRSLGVQWGAYVTATPTHGNSTGLVFPNILSVPSETASKRNFVVNMPTTVGSEVGDVGFIFGLAGDTGRLNQRLTTAELGGQLKTVSAPSAVTPDNTPVSISQALIIPYAYGVSSTGGATTTFIDDLIVATVTPHVTPNGSLLMQINVTNKQPNTGMAWSNGQLSLPAREASRTVLVKPGSMVVIGGIYSRHTSETDCEVPRYARIPLIGRFLGELLRPEPKDDRTEMMIFITPRVIKPAEPAVASMTVR